MSQAATARLTEVAQAAVPQTGAPIRTFAELVARAASEQEKFRFRYEQ
mgnify:CR=1 FL=1